MGKSKKEQILKDQLNRSIDYTQKPLRIVSLVPSITELLSYLGLDEQLVGITKFCIKPDHIYRTKKRIGGTKQVHFDQIDALNPDLIIANKEENTEEIVEVLSKKYKVYVSDIISYEDALDMIQDIGRLCHVHDKSSRLVQKIRKSFAELETLIEQRTFKAAYLVWNDPIMVAGNDTYIDSIFELLHISNGFKNLSRYPLVDIEAIQNADVDVLMLPSEPFPFKEKHKAYFQEILPDKKIILVKGEIFSWYGSYMLHIKTAYLEILNSLNK